MTVSRTRRQLMARAAAIPLASSLSFAGGRTRANTAARSATLRSVVGDAPLIESGLSLSVPLIAESGHAVSLGLQMKGVAVSRWVVIAEKNPRPVVLDVDVGTLGAHSPLSTRVRLGASQSVIALARTTQGAWHIAEANVSLTASACYDGT